MSSATILSTATNSFEDNFMVALRATNKSKFWYFFNEMMDEGPIKILIKFHFDCCKYLFIRMEKVLKIHFPTIWVPNTVYFITLH